jgi:hypothetical protein
MTWEYAMKMQRTIVWMALVASGLSAGKAIAAPVYPLYQYVFGQDNYPVSPGGTVDVQVYLQETIGQFDTPVLAPGSVGLIAAGVRLEAGDPPQPSQPARVLSTFDILENPAFDFPTPSLTGSNAGLSLGTLLNPTVIGREQSAGVFRMLLGTFRFTAGSLPGESTPLRATDYDPGFDDVVTGDMRVLDARPIYDGTATITVVPEPQALTLLAAAALAGATCWLRTRKT